MVKKKERRKEEREVLVGIRVNKKIKDLF